MLAARMRVVVDGPNAEGLLPPPLGRFRAEALPGDTVEVAALVASADGELDLDGRGALWFLTVVGGCLDAADQALVADDCSASETPDDPCAIGRGAAPRFVVPWQVGGFVPTLPGDICMVVGLERTTAECATAAGNDARGLRPSDCAFARIDAKAGPWIRQRELLGDEAVPIDIDEETLEHALEVVRPDAGPGIGSVTFAIGSPASAVTEPVVAPEGGVFEVPPGARIDIERTNDAADEQLFVRVKNGFLVGDLERVQTAGWYVGHPRALTYSGSQRRIYAPDEPGAFDVWVVVEDEHDNLGWGRFTIEVLE